MSLNFGTVGNKILVKKKDPPVCPEFWYGLRPNWAEKKNTLCRNSRPRLACGQPRITNIAFERLFNFMNCFKWFFFDKRGTFIFWNYNTLPSPNREMEIAHVRTYIQSLCFVLALLKENHPKVVQWQITGGKIRWKCFWFEVTSRLSSRIVVCRVHSVSP